MAVEFDISGDFRSTETLLRRLAKVDIVGILNSCGEDGVAALSSATPTDTGLASGSWAYKVSAGQGVYEIYWTNSDLETEFPVAIMLQYGYATGTGGYVQGRDYINPAMKPVFDQIADRVWRAVTSA